MKKVVLFGFLILSLLINGCGQEEVTGNVVKEAIEKAILCPDGTTVLDEKDCLKVKEKPKVESPKEIIYSINQNINVDYLTYKVTKAETFTEMGASMFKKETNGKFIKVYLTLLNNAKETKQIFTPRFKIIDNQGRIYDRLSDDMMYISDYLEWGRQLQPGLSTSGAIVFELPKDSTDLKLEIRGDWLSISKITISLSNIQNIGKDTTQKEEIDEMWDEAMEESQEQMDELMGDYQQQMDELMKDFNL